jgi:hypothetical protein
MECFKKSWMQLSNVKSIRPKRKMRNEFSEAGPLLNRFEGKNDQLISQSQSIQYWTVQSDALDQFLRSQNFKRDMKGTLLNWLRLSISLSSNSGGNLPGLSILHSGTKQDTKGYLTSLIDIFQSSRTYPTYFHTVDSDRKSVV